MNLLKLGVVLREKREALGIPLATLARRAGVGRSTLWSLERGENPKTGKPSRPAKDILERLAEALHLDAAELDELLDMAGYTTERHHAIRPSLLVSPTADAQGEASQLVRLLADNLQAFKLVAEDIRLELRDLKQSLLNNSREPQQPQDTPKDVQTEEDMLLFQYPTYYPAIFQDCLWNIVEENAAHIHLIGKPLKGRNLLEIFFSPDLRPLVDDWEQSTRRAMWYFRVSIKGLLDTLQQQSPEAFTQVEHQYQQLIAQLSVLPDFLQFLHSNEALGEIYFPDGPENPFPACELIIKCRLSSSVKLHFQTIVKQWRVNKDVHIHEVLMPQNMETKAALILMYLANTPMLQPGANDNLLRQALRVLALVKTVEEGLLFGELKRDWLPEKSYQRTFVTIADRFSDLSKETITNVMLLVQQEARSLEQKNIIKQHMLADIIANIEPTNPFLRQVFGSHTSVFSDRKR